MPKMDIGQLNDLYNKSDSCDKQLFSEMRSNILLASGDHYRNISNRLWDRVRHSRQNEPSKLRLTKNHVQKITKHYQNAILQASPGIKIFPYNDSELQDQKTAELNDSVWQDAKESMNYREKVRLWVDHFITIGEVCAKVFWDPNKGPLVGFKQQLSEDGEPMMGEDGQPVADKQLPVFAGEMQIEEVLPFNLLRPAEAETVRDSKYLIVRKMMDVKKLKKMYDGDEKAQEYIQESAEETYKVFDGYKGQYSTSKDQLMLREYYYRPCIKYPKGYFFVTTEHGILQEGELPFGIFPIVWKGDEEIPTSPRGHSLVKHLRPYQAEINRTASAIATTQITLGDDRVFVLNGSKVTKGINMPGIRVFNVTGQEPKIQSGRAGDQYFAYLQAQITEMYSIANLSEQQEAEKEANVQEIYQILYRSMKDKRKFAMKAQKFEEFQVELVKVFLALAKEYYPDWRVVRAAGRRESVNIEEFRNSSEKDIRIKVEPVTDDIDSTLGKSLQLQQIVQFMGNDLPDEAKGEIIKMMPFLNQETIFSSLTLDYENIVSDMLALDRGEPRQVGKYDNHKEYIRRLTNRIKKKDFDQLPPESQQLYFEKLQQHEQAEAEQQKELQAAQAGFIPTGGGLAKADIYEPDPKSPEKQRRATFPVEALQWLKERLDKQGLNQEQLQTLDAQNIADMAKMLEMQQQQPPALEGAPPPPVPGQLPLGGI